MLLYCLIILSYLSFEMRSREALNFYELYPGNHCEEGEVVSRIYENAYYQDVF